MIRTSLAFVAPSSSIAGAGAVVGSSKTSTGGSATAVIRSPSLPAEDEAIDAALDTALDELVAGGLAPGGEILGGARVRGEHLKKLAADHRLDGLGGLDDRHRAREALCVDPLCDLERHA